MHIEFLAEDQSACRLLEIIVPRILGGEHTCRFHAYKGLGRLPKDLRGVTDPAKRVLLDRLPQLLAGYGKTPGIDAVVVVVDVDRRPCGEFLRELLAVCDATNPCPRTLFRLAIEEIEAWLLGDLNAVRTAYPHANQAVLERYQSDSICGTWEVLKEAVMPGIQESDSYGVIGRAKSEWAERIGACLDLDRNTLLSG